MSHEITRHDSLILAAKPAWHGLGTVLPTAPTVHDGLELSGLNWQVERLPMLTEDGQTVPDAYAMRRTDGDRLILGTVGKDYRVFQNDQLFDFAQNLANDANVKLETAGSLRAGRDVFLLLQNDSFALGRNGDDVTNTYTLLRNTHDGSASLRVLGTSIRVVCANTLGYALSPSAKAASGISIRHTKSMETRLGAAQEALFASKAASYEFQIEATALSRKHLTSAQVNQLFVDVYQAARGAIPTNPQTASEERKRSRAVNVLADWEQRLWSPNQRLDGIEGTAWSALNAVTEWADHGRTVRVSTKSANQQEARAFSNLFGSSAEVKNIAKDKALALL